MNPQKPHVHRPDGNPLMHGGPYRIYFWMIDVQPWGRCRTSYRCTESEIRRAYVSAVRVDEDSLLIDPTHTEDPHDD